MAEDVGDFEDFEDFEDFDAYESGERIDLYFHIILATADQQPLLDEEWALQLGVFLNEVLVTNDGALLAADGGNDHLHLLVTLPPTISLEEAIKVIRYSSARWISKNIEGREAFEWDEEYFAETISPMSLDSMRGFVHAQREYHRLHTFPQEMRELFGIDEW